MVKQRHAKNPAKIKAQMRDPAASAPPEIFQRRLELRRRFIVALLCLLSVVLLTASFAPFDCWYLAYFALVPWTLALAGSERKKWPIVCSVLAGALFWAANLYWLWWVTLGGYAAAVVYLSAYWLVAALLVRGAVRRNWPMFLFLPVVWVALEFARAYVIGGFTWFFLAHSQYRQTQLIQVADLAGPYVVTFFVAMVNGAIVDLLISPLFVRRKRNGRLRWEILFAPVATALAAAGMLIYGGWQMARNTTQDGPVLGIVQRDFRISLDGDDENNGGSALSTRRRKVFDAHVEMSRRFIRATDESGAGPLAAVLWPETMLPMGMNAEFLDLSENQPRFRELHKMADEMAALSRSLRCPIIAGSISLHEGGEEATGGWLLRNSTVMFNQSNRSSAIYSKRNLVPFSEYVPFKESWPWLHEILRSCVPAAMAQLEPGKENRIFRIPRASMPGKPWRIATPICFEGTFSRVCRNMVVRDGKKVVDVLANISNDGWFVYKWRGKTRSSTEHAQHLVQYVFRAIENRVPVVRSVNTGISASIDSNGRILSIITYGGKTMVSGTLLLDGKKRNAEEYATGHGGKVLVDRRVSVYSLVGDLFAMAMSLAGLVLAGWLVLRRNKEGKQQ